MVRPRIWSGLEKQVYDALEETIDLYEELLAAGVGAGTEEERLRWRVRLNRARADLQELIERRR